jgi:hypothetical protein
MTPTVSEPESAGEYDRLKLIPCTCSRGDKCLECADEHGRRTGYVLQGNPPGDWCCLTYILDKAEIAP